MPRKRLAARVLVISPDIRLLLFKVHYHAGALAGRSYWATPGGKLKENESFEAAAVRELFEETGIAVPSVGRCVARREFQWQMADGEYVLATEKFYVVRSDAEHCSCAEWSERERDAVCEARWWSSAELAACREEIFPPDLSTLFSSVLLMAADEP